MTKIHALSKPYFGISNQIVTDVEIKNPINEKVVRTFGIWDTGATNTVVTQNVAAELELISIGHTNVQGVHDSKTVNRYFINVTLNNKNVSLDLPVTESKSLSPDDSIGLLIGMDIINRGDFAVTNFKGNTLMSFRVPSIQNIDFVKGIQQSKPLVNDKIPGRNSLCLCGSGRKYKHCHGQQKK